MKLLGHLVALTLLSGALGRASGSKRHNHHRPKEVLLGVRQQPANGTKVSLDGATDKLQGVLDAVSGSINQVLGGYQKVKDSCVTEVQASATRVEAQKVSLAEVETTRQVNLERTAGLEASLANLVSQETDAHASYESSVSQRAAALQKHLSTHKSTVDQANAIGKVLEMMKQKRAQITASQQDAQKSPDMKVVPPVAATSSGSGLDFVIGVLTNIQDTGLAKAEEGAEKHNEDDADIEKLVESYKTSLQHIDKQYQTENARRMEAKVTARDAGEEKSLRNMLVDGEEKLDKEFFGLCGADGKGGSVPAATEAADWLLSQFDHQSKSALNIMDGLPDLVAGAASFLSVEQRKLRGPAASKPSAKETTSDVDSAQESAARWVIEQAAKFKDSKTQRSAKAVAASFPNGVPPRKVHPVKNVAPSQQVHTLVGTNKSYQTQAVNAASQAAADPDADAAAAAIVACVKDKQDLTDKIIEARKAARTARTDRMSSEARAKAVKSFRELVTKQKNVLAGAQKATVTGWGPLNDLIAAKSFSADLTDAVSEMDTIEKDVDTYIKGGGPPAAAGLPKALAGIRETLTTVKTRLENDMKVLEGVYTGSLMISYPALINQLEQKDKNLDIEGRAMTDVVELAGKEAAKQEQAEKDLMVQRAGVEYRCMTEGTCGMLKFQLCCSGSGSFMKKVTSWKECADHCEGLVKEGKQIAGCEMTDLYKEDDRSGSGTCYAQTECSLKFAGEDSKCAGSLCKALPAKA